MFDEIKNKERDNQSFISEFKSEEKIETLKEEVKAKINEIINLSFDSALELNSKTLIYKLSSEETKEEKESLEKLRREFSKGKTQIWSGILATIDDIIMEFLKGKTETWLKENNKTLLDEEFDEEFIKETLEPIKAKILKSFGEEEIRSYITNLRGETDGKKYSIFMMHNPSSEIIEQSYQWTGK